MVSLAEQPIDSSGVAPASSADKLREDLPPFGPIGIALSGGGYRAAGFHLGTLAYLNSCGLLQNLRMLSTVSGGTFVGAAYTMSLVQGKPFQQFYDEFYAFLRDTNLVQLGLKRLADGKLEAPSGREDFIIAMADVYAQTFLKHPDGKPFRFGEILDSSIPLQEVTFNATEFRHGVAFRFQRSAKPGAKIGNGYFSLPRDEAAKIRLADIVAASSCFPGGFEPMAFPTDFVWPDGKVPPVVQQRFEKPVALMDGGVYDNQGVESLILADGRDADELGMFIISDVDCKTDDMFPFPKPMPRGWVTLGMVNILCWVMLGLSTTSSVAVARAYLLSSGHSVFSDTFLYGVPFLLAAGLTIALLWVRVKLGTEIRRIPRTKGAAWSDLQHLKVNQVIEMLDLRARSLIAMASAVFMKRIRGLVYGLIYRDEKYEKSRVSNLIYHLATGEKFESIPGVSSPSVGLRGAADVAARMPTTLWFEKNEELPALVICGQATTCYNLLKFVVRIHGRDPAHFPVTVAAFWKQLIADCGALQQKASWPLTARLKMV